MKEIFVKKEVKKLEGGWRCKPKIIGTQAAGISGSPTVLSFNQAHSLFQPNNLEFNLSSKILRKLRKKKGLGKRRFEAEEEAQSEELRNCKTAAALLAAPKCQLGCPSFS